MNQIRNINKAQLLFEDSKHKNGQSYWWASEFLKILGYESMKSFQKVLDKTIKVFVTLNIPLFENIIAENREIEGMKIPDYKLTRFACYLTVMNADPQKTEVAEAQVYFAQQVRKFKLFIKNSDQADRLKIRDALVVGNKSLASMVKRFGIEDYSRFQNAGYLGMYNMTSSELIKKRGLKKGTLLDHMGSSELITNLSRVKGTADRIIRNKIQGQSDLETTHNLVGKEIRDTIFRTSSINPESLPVEVALSPSHKEMQETGKKFKKKLVKKPTLGTNG